MGKREDCPTVDNSDKKRKIPLQTVVTTPEELKEATEIIVLVEEILQKRHANLKFEHLLLWWLSCEPIEA
jgi:hypothetical protein